MQPEVMKYNTTEEYWFEEGCFIHETANDGGDNLSIARARVPAQSKTKSHLLLDTAERYIIISGEGEIILGEEIRQHVEVGDVVRIPPDIRQCIRNTGKEDLVFYVICTPRFRRECYVSLD